ncbi:MAG: tRNA pseudouridine(55) synthase TruB, partial [Candidatus Marinimicrobia bacterium]|nr:tRNA pseudouridine(55) synthase TruB [Candidatus Neomarinimicrobiota bacterium]
MILNIYKPIGWTSFDVVKKVRNITHEKKVGHAGSLDPFAEGVLVIG